MLQFSRRVVFVFCTLFCLFAVLFFFYGPLDDFRVIWINTVMYSSRFKFLATMLYPDDYIEKILAKNFISKDEKTNAADVHITGGIGITCVPIKGNYYKGFTIKIDNPRLISLAPSSNPEGELLEEVVTRYNAIGGINASGYRDEHNRGFPWGYTVYKRIKVSEYSEMDTHIIGGFTVDYVLVVGDYSDTEIDTIDFLWAVEFGPLLIVNGKILEISEYAGGYAPRTAIGQTADGAVLLVVIDGRQVTSIGATFKDVQTILSSNGAINAICLDGGSSSTIMFNGLILNNPSEGVSERKLPNAIIIKSAGY